MEEILPEDRVKLKSGRDEVLDTAKRIVNGDRQQSYGEAEDSFASIARYWSHYTGTELSAKDVAVMMILLKVARLESTPSHFDSWVDICGYAALGSEMPPKRF